ncbi:DUF2975 domain-containing protein [Pontibacter harenae]|uniref:DUF2975 domain-containing protein n=1 Tax=Pontibacter harenae TaxID=2894083 RepID=UPI001E5693E3|nr:DUF2975 domain-containing protein [Pontibacter harenae]MCC9165239.1 DUF2975 domain-containing protein [Pontibacter harenae]
MKKNILLSTALQCCYVVRVLLIAIIIAITFAAVHSQVNPEMYSLVKIEGLEHKTSVLISTTRFELKAGDYEKSKGGADASKTVMLTDLNITSLVLLYLQTVAILIFWCLIVQQIIGVVLSVRELQTFRNSNSKSLRKIGWYCFAIFFLMAFRWADTESISFFGFYLHYMPIAFMLVSFILAEIFEEGSRLYEEEQLTI